MEKQIIQIILFVTAFRFTAFAQNDSLKGQELYSSDFVIDGIPRNITFYMPKDYGIREEYPLVFFLHPNNQSAKKAIQTYGEKIHAKADSSGCIVVYPDAVAGRWNNSLNKSVSSADSINDAGFLMILIDYFVQRYDADSKRIYIAGILEGGEMAYRLSCDIPSKITAIAILQNVNADTSQKCAAAETFPVFINNNSPNLQRVEINEAWDFLMAQVKE